jgi:hypothetical protein
LYLDGALRDFQELMAYLERTIRDPFSG